MVGDGVDNAVRGRGGNGGGKAAEDGADAVSDYWPFETLIWPALVFLLKVLNFRRSGGGDCRVVVVQAKFPKTRQSYNNQSKIVQLQS